MAYNDPVLQRSMFQKQAQSSALAPAVGLGGGIGSMSTPDQNAQALRSMFAPTVDIAGPSQMIQQPQQPVQSFQEGGLAEPTTTMPGSAAARAAARRAQAAAELEARAASETGPGIGTKLGAAALDLATLPYQFGAGFFGKEPTSLTPFYDEWVRRPRGQTGTAPASPAQKAGAAFGDVMASPAPVVQKIGSMIDPQEISPPESYSPRFDVLRRGEQQRAAEGAGVGSLNVARMLDKDRAEENVLSLARPPAAEKKEPSIETNLDNIRAKREATAAERSAAERRENALLALMQAGFAIAGGRSPNAISNIGAGGQAGIAAFASMERARREDESLRRREQLQLDIAKMQLDKDPEAVRTYAILGGWTPDKGREAYQQAVQRGFNISQSKEGPKLATTILNNPLLQGIYSQDDLKKLADYAKEGILGMGGSGGTAALPTVRLSPNQGQR